METIVKAKDQQAAEANNNASILLKELDLERVMSDTMAAYTVDEDKHVIVFKQLCVVFDSPERRSRSRPWLLSVRSARRNARRRRRSRRGSRRKRAGRKPRMTSVRCWSRRRIQMTVTYDFYH